MEETKELVNHPDHYKGENGIETIDAIEAALGECGTITFCVGNAIKYLMRARKKNAFIQDLRKAKWYIEYVLSKFENISKQS